MYLIEHDAKQLLARHGVPVPQGCLLTDPAAANALPPGPWVVKGQITAPTQKLANSLAKSLSHIAVHYPVPEWTGLITSVAFPYSPAEIDKGATYRFNMNHVVEPDNPLEMFRIGFEKV